jgi:calcium binding protein 39
MNRLFSRSKSPQDLVLGLKQILQNLEKGEKKYEKVADDITKYINGIKTILYGTSDQEPQTELIAHFAQEIYNAQLIKIMIDNLIRVDFESKKDIASIFNNLLRRPLGSRMPTVDHIATRPDILFKLINGYEQPEVALNCGMMLRECCRYEELTKLILNAEQFYRFFNYVELSTFDIASDAFLTFKVIFE